MEAFLNLRLSLILLLSNLSPTISTGNDSGNNDDANRRGEQFTRFIKVTYTSSNRVVIATPKSDGSTTSGETCILTLIQLTNIDVKHSCHYSCFQECEFFPLTPGTEYEVSFMNKDTNEQFSEKIRTKIQNPDFSISYYMKNNTLFLQWSNFGASDYEILFNLTLYTMTYSGNDLVTQWKGSYEKNNFNSSTTSIDIVADQERYNLSIISFPSDNYCNNRPQNNNECGTNSWHIIRIYKNPEVKLGTEFFYLENKFTIFFEYEPIDNKNEDIDFCIYWLGNGISTNDNLSVILDGHTPFINQQNTSWYAIANLSRYKCRHYNFYQIDLCHFHNHSFLLKIYNTEKIFLSRSICSGHVCSLSGLSEEFNIVLNDCRKSYTSPQNQIMSKPAFGIKLFIFTSFCFAFLAIFVRVYFTSRVDPNKRKDLIKPDSRKFGIISSELNRIRNFVFNRPPSNTTLSFESSTGLETSDERSIELGDRDFRDPDEEYTQGPDNFEILNNHFVDAIYIQEKSSSEVLIDDDVRL